MNRNSRKIREKFFAVGLFCYDKFEETPNEKVVNMSKWTKPYFKDFFFAGFLEKFAFSA